MRTSKTETPATGEDSGVSDLLEETKDALEELLDVALKAKPPVVNVQTPPAAINVTEAHRPKSATIVSTRSDGTTTTHEITFHY
jgi:hypothetical protein